MPSITIKNNEFTYPTLEELRVIRQDMPRLNKFGFPYVYEVVELLQNVGSMEDVSRRSHLHWWDHCLVNRIGSLNHAYTTALTHYNRGLPDDINEYQHEHYVNRTQFGFYGETYFYIFMSVRDTIVQLVNVYFSMGIPEKRLQLNKDFPKKIPNNDVADVFTLFLDNTQLTSDYRNGLAHRFLLTQPDYRPTVRFENGGLIYEAGLEAEIKSSQLHAEIKRSMSVMAKFLDDLQLLMK